MITKEEVKEAIKYLNNLDWDDSFYITLAALTEYTETHFPEPLSLEQLKQMRGQPVFVVSNRRNDWFILHSFHGQEVCGRCFILTHRTAAKYQYLFDDYGKTWVAYAHKPEGG